ncbi:UNVERIFIED_CONTAM: hypothetical protein GTU68_008609 [Idotea baltica]|nr:hypothetical protein [Idotea baltica]
MLLKGLDNNKDQSYFLHAVEGKQLAKTLFPVGELNKPEVRAIAEQNHLATAKKKDSTGICFIGERKFRDFLQNYLPAQPGNIEDIHQKVIGTHQGLMYHTIGQRQGLGIGGLQGASEEPWYVLQKDLKRNVLIVGQGDEHPWLYANTLFVPSIYWVNSAPTNFPHCLSAKIRYRQADQACSLEAQETGYIIRFEQPQRAITPGQSVVLYDTDICLGGGVIEKAIDQDK